MYAKLFSSILDSSVWTLPVPTRIVWITMLAMADRYGHVYSSRSGLARRALVSEEDCSTALETLLAPDDDSSDKYRNPDNEGRRIENADGGWTILNYGHYQAIKDSEERRAQVRAAVRRYRERNRKGNHDEITEMSPITDDVGHHSSSPQIILTSHHTSSDHTETTRADAPVSESESPKSAAKAKPRTKPLAFVPPTQAEVKEFAEKRNLTIDPEDFYLNYRKNGWKVSGRLMVDWKAAMLQWQKRKEKGEFA